MYNGTILGNTDHWGLGRVGLNLQTLAHGDFFRAPRISVAVLY